VCPFVVSCRVVSCRVASHRIASHRIASHRVVSCHVLSCRVVSPRALGLVAHYSCWRGVCVTCTRYSPAMASRALSLQKVAEGHGLRSSQSMGTIAMHMGKSGSRLRRRLVEALRLERTRAECSPLAGPAGASAAPAHPTASGGTRSTGHRQPSNVPPRAKAARGRPGSRAGRVTHRSMDTPTSTASAPVRLRRKPTVPRGPRLGPSKPRFSTLRPLKLKYDGVICTDLYSMYLPWDEFVPPTQEELRANPNLGRNFSTPRLLGYVVPSLSFLCRSRDGQRRGGELVVNFVCTTGSWPVLCTTSACRT